MLDGQVKTFHHADLCRASSRGATSPTSSRSSEARGHRADRHRRRQRPAVRRRDRAGARRHRPGDRDDRRRRRGAPRRGRAQPGGRRRGLQPGPLPADPRRAQGARPGQPGAAGPARGGGVRHGRRVPRRDRRLPQPALRDELPEAPGDGPREGHRPALRREPAPDRRPVPRDDAPLDRRRRRDESSRAARRRSTTCSTSTSPTRSPRDYTTPTVVIAKHTDPVGLASADELVEAYRRALETDPVASFGGDRRRQPDARRRDGAGDRRELVRGGDRARLRRFGDRHPPPEAGPRAAPRPARPDRGHARLRHRPARLQARRRRPARRDDRRPRASTAASSRSSRSAARRSRS